MVNGVACAQAHCNLGRFAQNELCILHSDDPTRNEGEFINALRQYEFDNGYIYRFINFPIDFAFEAISIQDDIRFWNCVFQKEIVLEGMEIQGNILFSECLFRGNARIINTEFLSRTAFRQCEFEKAANFELSSFKDEFEVNACTFAKGVNFALAHLTERTKFLNCSFGCSSFVGATGLSSVRFNSCSWDGKNYLAEEEYTMKVENVFPIDVYLRRSFVNQIWMFVVSKFRHPNRKRWAARLLWEGDYRIQQNLADEDIDLYLLFPSTTHYLKNAEGSYRNLSSALTMSGEPDLAMEFLIRAKSCRRMTRKPLRRIIDYLIFQSISHYGLSPFRVIISSIFVITLFSIVYWAKSDWISPVSSTGLSYLTSLYFSIVTFTTLGYGDFSPLNALRIFTSIEALSGAVLIALLVATFTNKMTRY